MDAADARVVLGRWLPWSNKLIKLRRRLLLIRQKP